jgi:hypothetical protein
MAFEKSTARLPCTVTILFLTGIEDFKYQPLCRLEYTGKNTCSQEFPNWNNVASPAGNSGWNGI